MFATHITHRLPRRFTPTDAHRDHIRGLLAQDGGSATVGKLALHAGLSRARLAAVIRDLERRGLVHRRHRRSGPDCRVSLTPSGRAALGALVGVVEDADVEGVAA